MANTENMLFDIIGEHVFVFLFGYNEKCPGKGKQ